MDQNQIGKYSNRENLDPQTMYICLKRDKLATRRYPTAMMAPQVVLDAFFNFLSLSVQIQEKRII